MIILTKVKHTEQNTSEFYWKQQHWRAKKRSLIQFLSKGKSQIRHCHCNFCLRNASCNIALPLSISRIHDTVVKGEQNWISCLYRGQSNGLFFFSRTDILLQRWPTDLSSGRLTDFRPFLCNRGMNFDETWKEAHTQRLLSILFYLSTPEQRLSPWPD